MKFKPSPRPKYFTPVPRWWRAKAWYILKARMPEHAHLYLLYEDRYRDIIWC